MDALNSFFASGMVVSSLILFVIGLPVQIYKNYKRKSVEGISLPLFLSYFAAYVIWLSYGVSLGDWPIVVTNVPATIAAAIMLYQFIVYRKKSI